MFASFIVYLRPLETAPLGRTLGRSLHGLLLRLISQTDPHLANTLHSDISPKPFTVSNLHRPAGAPRPGLLCATPAESYRVRYTVLTDETFNTLGHVLLGKLAGQEPVEIDGKPFVLEDIVVDAGRSEGWAQRTGVAG